MISAQMHTGQRFVVVRNCATVVFLTPFSICGVLGIRYCPNAGSHCRVEVHGVFCLIIYPISEGCLYMFLPFSSSGVLTRSHSKGKCTCNQFSDGCVQVGICLLVDVEDYICWYIFLFFVLGSIVL